MQLRKVFHSLGTATVKEFKNFCDKSLIVFKILTKTLCTITNQNAAFAFQHFLLAAEVLYSRFLIFFLNVAFYFPRPIFFILTFGGKGIHVEASG